MKIQGSSKIISPKKDAVQDEISEDKQQTQDVVNSEKLESLVTEKEKSKAKNPFKDVAYKENKEELENLVNLAETDDLIHEETKIKGKIKRVKGMAKDLIEKTKPFREKQKELAVNAVKKARDLSPHVDKLITVMDKSITYMADPSPLDGRSNVVQETRAPSVFGIWVMLITFGVFMMWAILAPLDSASHAQGKIILESKKRLIQHPEGGVIKEILVKDGDEVEKDQTLITLDDTQLKARKLQHEYKYLGYLAEVARLTAEKDSSKEIKFPEELLKQAGDPEIQKMIHTQEKVFESRAAAFASRISHAEKTIEQHIEKKNAILPQIEAAQKLVKISATQVESYKKLQKKGNISISTLQEAESKHAQSLGNEGALRAQLAETKHVITQSEVTVESYKNDFFEKTLGELKENQANLSIANESLKEVSESLKRTVIVAPISGTVSNISELISTNGVLPQQQQLMEIIPQDDKLIVEAKILPTDIAAVKVGQLSRIRLTAYRARIVPVLEGTVTSLSADLVLGDQRDLQMGLPAYYKVRIEIDKGQLIEAKKNNDVQLYPGMGVDVIIVIGTRTMMKYLMDPITMTLDKAFKER
jgi:HlyD family secretion protein